MSAALRPILPGVQAERHAADLASAERWTDFARGLVCGVILAATLVTAAHVAARFL